MHPIYDVEIFSGLIMAADNYVHALSAQIAKEKKQLREKGIKVKD